MILSTVVLLVSLIHVQGYGGLEISSSLINTDVGGSPTNIQTDINIFSANRIPDDNSNLDCPVCDGYDERERELKCACTCKLKWNTDDLLVEYISVDGKSVVIIPEKSANSTWLNIEHTDGYMGYMPSNLCEWGADKNAKDLFDHYLPLDANNYSDGILVIDFTSNRIKQIPDLNCLSNLHTLKLRNNRIGHLSNSSFSNLSSLRVLDLGYNSIKTMDPTTITNPRLHIARFYLENNKLSQLDISNCISLYPFCSFNFDDNNIREFTNVNNYTLDPDYTYGPGVASLRYNNIIQFPDLKPLLNLDSIQMLGQLLDFGWDLKDCPVICDGWMQPYLEVARQSEVTKSFWNDYANVTCDGPPGLKGRSIEDILYRNDIDKLVTNYSCFQNCKCQDRPSQDYVYVDCAGLRLTNFSKGELPSSPYCNKIHLNISNNNIQFLSSIPNLNKVTVLDVCDNDIVDISPEAAHELENVTQLNLANNANLKSIPEQLRYLNSCNLHLGGVILKCDCDSLWLSDWSKKNTCPENKTVYQCLVPGIGLMPVDDFHKDMIDCDEQGNFYKNVAIVLGVLLFSITLLFVAVYQLRYEVLVIILRLRRRKKTQITPSFRYDAYISFDEDNDLLRKWVNTELVLQLEGRGYRNFLTYRDIAIGDIRDKIVIDVLNHTKNFVLILSQSYFDQDGINWSELEWKHGWNMYKDNNLKNIVLINFDHVSSFDVDHPQIKAFLRVGGQVTFTNQNRDIMHKISMKLGPPSAQISVTNQGFVNRKPKLDITSLFCLETMEISKDHKNVGQIGAVENAGIKYKHHERLNDVPDINDEQEINDETEKEFVNIQAFDDPINSGTRVLDTQAKPVFNMKYLQEEDITITTL